ncbi:hypothetical protein [Nocardioides taihuensis]|uniref:DUF732 domain-containing protein n=1 Tax=Nocardioides taihuensis TaxID=1835606 RepID=A0ABW0BJ47_9ACTN
MPHLARPALALAGLSTLAATALIAPAAPASAAPDTSCMRAGIAVLKDAGLLPTVAKSGLPLSLATSPEVGVTVRPGADISGVPDPVPLSVLLADHRAGDNSLFVYPWC